jgi:hypothetical protein
MPQINLYQTEVDELEFMKGALKEGCKIVPDCNYATPEIQILNTLEEFQCSRLSERHFFILHERFIRLPLQLRPISKDGKTVYYISPSQGGPFVEFLGGGIFEDEKTQTWRIRSGFLAHPSNYWDANITKRQASPPELMEIYKRLAEAIRATSTRIKPDRSVYWLGNDAQAQLLRGAKLGLHEDWFFPSGSPSSE